MSITNNGHDLTAGYSSAYYTFAQPMSFNVDTLVTGIGFYSYTTQVSSDLQAYLWSSSMTLLASSNLSSAVTLYNQPYAPYPTVIKFTTPYLCTAGTVYYLGGYQRYQAAYANNVDHTTHSVGLVDGVMISTPNATYPRKVVSGNTASPTTNNTTYEWQFAVEFDNTKPPTAPTGVSVAGNVPIGGNPTMSWTHNDPDGDAQTKYQIRWRKT